MGNDSCVCRMWTILYIAPAVVLCICWLSIWKRFHLSFSGAWQPVYNPVVCQMTLSAKDVCLLHRFYSTTVGGGTAILNVIPQWVVWWTKVWSLQVNTFAPRLRLSPCHSPQSITDLSQVLNYTVWWQRHMWHQLTQSKSFCCRKVKWPVVILVKLVSVLSRVILRR